MPKIYKRKPRKTKRLCRSIKSQNTCEKQLDNNQLRRCVYNTKHKRCFDLPVRCRARVNKKIILEPSIEKNLEETKKPVILSVEKPEIKQIESSISKLNQEILERWEDIQEKRRKRLRGNKKNISSDLLTQIRAGKELKKYTGEGYKKLKKDITMDKAKSCLLKLKYKGIWSENINKEAFIYKFRKWIDNNKDDISNQKDFYDLMTSCEHYEDMYDLMSQADSLYKLRGDENKEDYKKRAKSCLTFMKNNNLWKNNMDYIEFIDKISSWVPINSKSVTIEMLRRYEELLEACSGEIRRDYIEDFIKFMSQLDSEVYDKPSLELNQVPLFVKERQEDVIQKPSLTEQIRAGIKLRKTPPHKRATFKEEKIIQKARESIPFAIKEKIRKQSEQIKNKEDQDDDWELKVVVNSG